MAQLNFWELHDKLKKPDGVIVIKWLHFLQNLTFLFCNFFHLNAKSWILLKRQTSNWPFWNGSDFPSEIWSGVPQASKETGDKPLVDNVTPNSKKRLMSTKSWNVIRLLGARKTVSASRNSSSQRTGKVASWLIIRKKVPLAGRTLWTPIRFIQTILHTKWGHTNN